MTLWVDELSFPEECEEVVFCSVLWSFITADGSLSLTPHTDLLITGQLCFCCCVNLKTFTHITLNKSSVDPVTGEQTVRYSDRRIPSVKHSVHDNMKYNHIIFNHPLT